MARAGVTERWRFEVVSRRESIRDNGSQTAALFFYA
jgi:hypothetical protein